MQYWLNAASKSAVSYSVRFNTAVNADSLRDSSYNNNSCSNRGFN